MLKKIFALVVAVVSVSVLANDSANYKKINFSNVTSEQVTYMKDYCSKNKNYHAAVYAIAVYAKENPSEALTIEKMENIAKKNVKYSPDIYPSVIAYVQKTNQINKFSLELAKNSNYKKTELFKWLVINGTIKFDNANEWRVNYIKTSKNKTRIIYAINAIIENASSMKDEDAVKYLTDAYRAVLPKLVDMPELKNIATKLGLTLKSYGVDVK